MANLPGGGRDIIEPTAPHRGPTRNQYGEAPGHYCVRCHGKGFQESVDSFTGQMESKPCEMCGGSGANPWPV